MATPSTMQAPPQGAINPPVDVKTEVGHKPAMSSIAPTPPSTAPSQEPYRFPWGKHKGKLLTEIPLDYIQWLQRSSDVVVVIFTTGNFEQLSSSFQPSSLVTTPTDTTRTHPSNTSVSEGPYVLTFGKHKGEKLDDVPPHYVEWLKKNDALKNNPGLAQAVAEWDKVKRVYRLCFGKYEGYTLDEVPPSYLTYLHNSKAAAENDDLKKALAEHKHANAAEQASKARASNKKPFRVPDEVTHDYRRYYFNGDRRSGQMWIGCHDALRYFGADAKAMSAAGLRSFHRGQRFWVHQVFAYAKHFGTTRSETPTQALKKFKVKNHYGP